MPEIKGVYSHGGSLSNIEAISLRMGPIRPYVHINETQIQKRLNTNVYELFQLLAAVTITIVIRLYCIEFPNKVLLEEIPIVSAINSYLTGRFFLDINPPFVPLLFSALSRSLGYGVFTFEELSINSEYDSFPYQHLRVLNAIVGGLAVIYIYKILKISAVNHYYALFGVFLFALENSMITQSRFMFTDSFYILFVAIFVCHHKLMSLKTKFSASWFFNLLICTTALGLTISTHWSGLFLIVYAFLSSTITFWIASGDIDVSMNYLRIASLIKDFAYLTIPFTIYLYFFNLHLSHLDSRGESYNLLSPAYQHSLKETHLDGLIADVSYGSTVMIRHFKSGEYLHSHNDFYRTSKHQQVTLFDNFDDFNNFFKIYPVKGNSDRIMNDAMKIFVPHKVKIKHVATDSFLVADSDFKPPLSEQEYNSEVTTQKDFSEMEEDTSEFQLKISTKYTKDEKARVSLRAIESVFQIYNKRSDCYLLGTPLLLTEGFAESQHELICIKEPEYEASLWYIDWNKHDKYSIDSGLVDFPELGFWDKFVEIHFKVFKKLFVGDIGYNNGFSVSFTDWLFLRKGYVHFLDTEAHSAVYLLGNYITYHLVILVIFIYSVFKAYQLMTTNPYQHCTTVDVSVYIYDHQMLDLILGYTLTLLLRKFVKIDLQLFDYLPILFFGILCVPQTFQLGHSKAPKFTFFLTIISCLLVFLAFKKYSPLIYGLQWSYERCMKMMVGPGWDSGVCKVYYPF